METYLTAKEVAEMVRLTVQTIRRYTMRNQIPFHKINRAVRYKKSEIELWVERRKVSAVERQNTNNEDGLFKEAETGGEL